MKQEQGSGKILYQIEAQKRKRSTVEAVQYYTDRIRKYGVIKINR